MGLVFSIDIKRVPVTLHFMSKWRFNNVRVIKIDFTDFCCKKTVFLSFLREILGIMRFRWIVLLIMKGNDYYNIHKKLQTHSTNFFFFFFFFFFWLGAKKKRQLANIPSNPEFNTLLFLYPKEGWYNYNSTISCSHLVVEKRFSGPKRSSRGW